MIEPRPVLVLVHPRSGWQRRLLVATVHGPSNGGGQDLEMRPDALKSLRAGERLTVFVVPGVEARHAEWLGAGCPVVGYQVEATQHEIELRDGSDGRVAWFFAPAGTDKR